METKMNKNDYGLKFVKKKTTGLGIGISGEEMENCGDSVDTGENVGIL